MSKTPTAATTFYQYNHSYHYYHYYYYYYCYYDLMEASFVRNLVSSKMALRSNGTVLSALAERAPAESMMVRLVTSSGKHEVKPKPMMPLMYARKL